MPDYAWDEKWIPGPWRVGEDEHNLRCQPWTRAIPIEAPNDPGCGSIPSIMAWTTRGGSEEANARLMATAPTFADIAARAQYLANTRGGDYDSLSRDELLGLMLEYDAALTKARGDTVKAP